MTLTMTMPRAMRPRGAPRFVAKISAAVGLVALSDVLFYAGLLGISLPLFLTAVATSVSLTVVPRVRLRKIGWRFAVPVLGFLPLVETVSPLSMTIGLASLAAFTLMVSNRLRTEIPAASKQVAGFLVAVAFRFVPDAVRWRMALHRLGIKPRMAWATVWLVPLALGGIFILLFASANPIFERWLSLIDLWRVFDWFELNRLIFWALMLIAVWGFLRPRISWFQRPRVKLEFFGPPAPARGPRASVFGDVVFGEGAILRALIVFNLIFAAQTVLDLAYLWGGIALPDGMTYAEYAHRGAYPLIVTALLAAGFVLIATRDGSRSASNPLIRGLVYTWIAQNVMLVVSSILRLDLYVGIYALTYWRVAAFIWMGLVGAGLVLILARLALGRSNQWLISANLLLLFTVLYICGYFNVAGFIADYNVDHRPRDGDPAVTLDTWYIGELGPEAIPAIDRLLAMRAADADCLATQRQRLARRVETAVGNWRSWTYRDWRIKAYLDTNPAPVVPGQCAEYWGGS